VSDTKPKPDPLPWEKLSGESAKAFAAFVLYRDLRAQRSLTKVARLLHETGTPTSRSQLGEWSVRWSWVERVDAYDREQDRLLREEQEEAISHARRTESMVGTLMLGAALRRLAGDDESRVIALNLNEVSAMELVRLAEAGTKILDKSLGIGGDFSGVTTVPGAAVYDLARGFLALATNALDEGMRAAAGANGNLGELIAQAQARLIEDAGTFYTRTVR
jgi:hypothetical protein